MKGRQVYGKEPLKDSQDNSPEARKWPVAVDVAVPSCGRLHKTLAIRREIGQSICCVHLEQQWALHITVHRPEPAPTAIFATIFAGLSLKPHH